MKTVTAALLALSVVGPALAQDIDRDDIPIQCTEVCSNIATVSDDCDRRFDRDRDELACMCQAENAREVVPLCAACVEMYNTDNDDDDDRRDDNDVSDLRRDCSFDTTSYNPSTTYAVVAMTAATTVTSGGASGQNSPTPTSQDRLSSALDSVSQAATASGANTASLSSVINSVSSDLASQASSAAGAANTDNAGTSPDSAPAALAGAALLAAAAWL